MLNNSSQKALLLIMRRSVIPIEFNSVVIITLNLDSFVSVSINQYDFTLLIIVNISNNIKCFYSYLKHHTRLTMCLNAHHRNKIDKSNCYCLYVLLFTVQHSKVY